MKFGDFRLDVANACVWREEQKLKLTPKEFRVLRYLVEHRDRVVERVEFRREVWAGVHVSSDALEVCIKRLRQALADTTKPYRFIETVPTLGYRFLRPVQSLESEYVQSLKSEKAPHTHPLISRPQGRETASTFIGRQQEVALLQHRLLVAQQGHGQVVSIVGEPGMGKTRLLHEAQQTLAAETVTYLEGRCLSHGSTIPYLPLLGLVRQLGHVQAEDTPAVIAEKLQRLLHGVGVDAEQQTPSLLHLLGLTVGTAALENLSSEAVKTRTIDLLVQMFLRTSQQQPVLIAVEDLHWIDRFSEEVLTMLVERLPGHPFLLMVTYRAGYRPPWIGKSYATQIALPPLSPQESKELLHSLTNATALPETLQQQLLSKAQGNPFFLEELTRAVTDSQLQFTATVPLAIHTVLATRMQHLSTDARQLLHTAAVLGRSFSRRLLAATWNAPLDHALAELRQQEFLFAQTQQNEVVYVFKHALTQDVAYESLSPKQRRVLHGRAGQALETLYAHRLTEVYDQLAYHYARTHEHAKAFEYLTRFAESASRRYAHAEAVTALNEALAHAQQLPPEQQDRAILTLLPALAFSSFSLMHFQESLDVFLHYQPHAQRLQDARLTGPYHFWIGYFYNLLGSPDAAFSYLQRALADASRCGDEATAGKTHYELARGYFWLGQLRQGLAHAQQAIPLLQRAHEQWWLGLAHCMLGINYHLLGEFAAALRAYEQATAIGVALADKAVQAYAAFLAGWAQATRGAWQEGITHCEHTIQLDASPATNLQGYAFLGYCHLEKGDFSIAREIFQQCLVQSDKAQMLPMKGWFSIWMGEAYLRDGQLAAAEPYAHEALTIVTSTKSVYWIGLAERLLGELALAIDKYADAATHLHTALEIFTSGGARFDEGRTHLILANVARAQTKRQALRTHVTAAYRLFTELKTNIRAEQVVRFAKDCGIGLDEI